MEPARTLSCGLHFLLLFTVPGVLFEEASNRIKAAETFPSGPSGNDADDVFFLDLPSCRKLQSPTCKMPSTIHSYAGSNCWFSWRGGRKSWGDAPMIFESRTQR